jgi:ACR3 family arsenite efflux pump ArsB
MFLIVRFSPLDIRVIPGIGPIMLVALVIAIISPVLALGIAAVALMRQPRAVLGWLILGCAVAACCAEGLIFAATKWL